MSLAAAPWFFMNVPSRSLSLGVLKSSSAVPAGRPAVKTTAMTHSEHAATAATATALLDGLSGAAGARGQRRRRRWQRRRRQQQQQQQPCAQRLGGVREAPAVARRWRAREDRDDAQRAARTTRAWPSHARRRRQGTRPRLGRTCSPGRWSPRAGGCHTCRPSSSTGPSAFFSFLSTNQGTIFDLGDKILPCVDISIRHRTKSHSQAPRGAAPAPECSDPPSRRSTSRAR